MSQSNPIRLFVTHAWAPNDDYLRVFEYLESARNFYYRNHATPDHPPAGDREAEREDLRRQIGPAEAVIALPSVLQQNRELFLFQITFTQACKKPVLMMRNFGDSAALPRQLTDLADEVVEWDGRALVDAVKRKARHEDTNRWEVVEFKLD
ncbi:MAG TPA: hypothetical protein VMB48_09885 [Steroidobacteraceae bacterium]|nr:hypothetical protein [Steroidobacteraceae bacterium]